MSECVCAHACGHACAHFLEPEHPVSENEPEEHSERPDASFMCFV